MNKMAHTNPRSVLVWLVIVLYMVFFSVEIYANTLKRIPLKYRDAAEVRQVIAPLLPNGSGIEVDHNSLIISAPDGVMKSTLELIASMDKPQKTLLISVFRGKYPNKPSVKLSTTETKINHLQTIRAEEGQTIVVSEKGLLKITVSEASYANNSEVLIDPAAPIVDRTLTQVVANDGELVLANPAVEDTPTLGVLSLDRDGSAAKGEMANSQRSELLDVPTGIHLRAILIGKNQVRVNTKVVSAAHQKVASDDSLPRSIALSNSVETMATFAINTWTPISEKTTFTHLPELGSNRKVYSTSTADDDSQSVWVKVELSP
jgi:hypothetical protein